MNRFFLSVIILLTITLSCGKTKNSSPKTDLPKSDSTQKSVDNIPPDLRDKTLIAQLTTVFGYRFIVEGDFNGDGKQEKLVEHYFDSLTGKESNKFYENISYDQLVEITAKYKAPECFLTSTDERIDTFWIAAYGQLLGLSYLKNEGDLNGDGTDEISYVVNNADWSNSNSCHLATYKNKEWKHLYSFPIWDWQIPDLPETFNRYGLFGLQDKIINTTNDTINQKLEKELKEFPGFIQKITNNKIQVRYQNEEASEDTMIVDLRRLPK